MRVASFAPLETFRSRKPAFQPGEPAPLSPPSQRISNPIRLIAALGLMLVAAIVAAVWILLANLRNEQLKDSEHDLENLAMVLAEQIDRSLQSIELIQNAVVERVRDLGVVTPDQFEERLAGFETHRRLKDQIGALPHIDAMVLTTPTGKLVNFSRGWPVPDLPPPGNRTYEAFNANPELMSFFDAPLRNPADGGWVLPLSRRITGAKGEYLGVAIGVIRISDIEQFFKTVARNNEHSIALFKRDGSLIARFPQDEKLRNTSFAHRPIFKDILAKSAFGTVLQSGVVDDRQYLISGHNLPHYPYSVVATKSVDDALAGWRYAALYVGVGAVIIIVMIAGAALLVSRKIGHNLQAQNRRLDAALNNMSQGLTMFDESGRLIVCNKRYAQMYKMPPDAVKPGTSLTELLCQRVANNTCFIPSHISTDDYVAELLARVGQGSFYSFVSELSDGRTIAVVNRPMPGGGWVATHDDITETRRREDSFRLLFEGSPIPMWVHDLDTMGFLAVNDAAIAQYGYSREQFMAMTVLDMRPPEDRTALLEMLRDLENVPFMERICRHRKADGSSIDVSTYFRILDYEGKKASLVAMHNITARKLAEDQLRRTQKFLDIVVENVPVPILVKEVDQADSIGNYRYSLINRATEDLFGISRDYILGKTPAELFPEQQAKFIVAENKATLVSEHPIFTSDHSVDTFLNGRRTITARSVAVRDDAQRPQYLLTVLEDVTERRHTEQGIARMAHHDALTDLPNRTTFNDAIEAAIESAQKSGEAFALLSLDLDGFKEANDTYGHSVGDALLRKVAQRLEGAAESAFVARIGGDEFTVIVGGGKQPETAIDVAERLLASISGDIEVEDRRIKVGATVGGAIYPTDGSDAKTLMSNADVALYRAKAATRGTVIFYEPAMGEQLRERRALQDELRTAIGRDELLLHYQPQKTMVGKAVGFEALARWQSPTRGMVSPAQFIPIAEESGLIIPVGAWVLRQACREAASWRAPLTVAVNISPVQFRTGDLPQLVQTVLMETGLSPARLELEITENVLIDDFSRAISILCRLKSLGVRIALDDFGSGYSSLSYLHSFSFDKIKIDRTFVGDLDNNRHSKAIVRAVIDLGHSLNVPILAEGVETPAQHEMLERNGCDEVQGYLTGRPRPITDYGDLTGAVSDLRSHYAAAG